MGKPADLAKKFLYRNLTLEGYLRTVSRLFFAVYGMGVVYNSAASRNVGSPNFKKIVSR